MTAEWARWRCNAANEERTGQARRPKRMRGEMPAKKRGKNVGNTPHGFLPPDDPVYSTGLIVAGIPVEKRREKEEISREPKRYSHFFTGWEKPIMLRPEIGPAREDHGPVLQVRERGCGEIPRLPEGACRQRIDPGGTHRRSQGASGGEGKVWRKESVTEIGAAVGV